MRAMSPHRVSPVVLALASLAIATAGTLRAVTFEPAATAEAAPTPTFSPSPSPTPTPRPSPTPSRAPVAARPLYPLPAAPAHPKPCPPPKRPRRPYTPWKPPVFVPDTRLPAPAALRPRRVDLDAIRGKGMWIYQWPRTERGDVAAVVGRARAAGLTQVWVRSGSTKSGFYAAPVLHDLLPAAHAAGLSVVVWDFPYLHDPVGDARRAAQTLAYTAPGGHRVDGFSPDIETAGEGTIASARRAAVYLSLVRRAAGNRPVIATVPRASDQRMRTYPYATMARYVDAFAPMVYWSCREPGALAVQSLQRLVKLRPVHLIGQAYDMGDEGGRPGNPTAREIWRFLDAGRRGGAIGVSFYVWQTSTADQWRALGAFPWPPRR